MKRMNLTLGRSEEKRIRDEAMRSGKPQSEIARNYISKGMQDRDDRHVFIRDRNEPDFDWQKIMSGDKATGYEREMLQEGSKEFKQSGLAVTGNVQIPSRVLAQRGVLAHRDMTVGTADQGGYTVPTHLLAGSFIELLQNKLVVKQAGATMLTNLSGDVAIPKVATGATAAWEGENDENAESSPTFAQLTLSPNRVGTYVEMSKQLQVQSSLSVNHVIQNLLSDGIAQALDLAALHGTGANNQPLGLAGTSGIGSAAGGTNGLIPSNANIVELESDVAEANGIINDSTCAYITNSKVRGILKQVFRNTTGGDTPLWENNMLNGYQALASSQVSDSLTKGSASGSCSAIFFGDWSQLFIAQWGGLDLVIDPYSQATTNKVVITANAYFDIGIRNVESFSVMLDALTA